MNFLDLARDRLQAALVHADLENPEFQSQLSRQFNLLNDQINQIQENLTEMLAEQQASPMNRANYAMSQGAPGLAIQELEEALQINASVNTVKPLLVDLYCDTGQPEKALDILATSTTIDDPTLGTEPGTPAYRQGRVYFLLGNYTYAASLWKNYAIRQIRLERSFAAMGAGLSLLHGEAKHASTLFMSLPTKLTTQAGWENELALCELESGDSTRAAEDFTSALTLMPNLPTRPVAAYYLEKMGKPVPPLPKPTDETEGTKPPAEEAKPKADEAKPPAEADKPAQGEPKADRPADQPAPEKPKESEAAKPSA
jgi:tetratricopeptide (TPR) repeat protein